MKNLRNKPNGIMSYTDYQISGNIIKLLLHKEFVENKKTPISCQFILTNRCNLQCCFCCSKKRDKTTTIDTEAAFRILRDLRDLGCKGIEFTGGAEPTLHKNFVSILEKTFELGMSAALVTNGTLLTGIPRELLAKLDWIRISLNASGKNYKKIHGKEYYKKVIEGLNYINDLPIPNIGISYIFCNETTFDDAQELIYELQSFKINYFRFSVDVFNNPNFTYIKPIFVSKNFKIIYHSERDTYIPKQCAIFYYKPVIDCNGLIYPCCTNLNREVMPLGHVKDLKLIWKSRNIEIDTSKCLYCIYGKVNDLIYELEKNQIKNINFI